MGEKKNKKKTAADDSECVFLGGKRKWNPCEVQKSEVGAMPCACIFYANVTDVIIIASSEELTQVHREY